LEPINPDIEKYYGVFRKDVGNIDIDEIMEESLTEALRDDYQIFRC